MTRYAQPGRPDSVVHLSARYENFIDGKWVPPVKGHYMVNLAPATAKPICEVAKSTPEDVETALDAAHHAKDEWGRASAAERARVLNEIADAIDSHHDMLAVAKSWENGKPVRETLAADIPLAADHFRYFAAAVRAEQTKITEIDEKTIAYHFHEPLGVVGQIIPFNFPILMAAWKIEPARAAGNCTVIKPASATPWSILKLAEVIGHIVPPGVLNIVTGPGAEIGKALAANPRIAKVAFTGETVTGRLIMQYAAQNIIPVTLELGGNRRTSSSPMSWRPTTPSSTRPWRAWCCTRSTRVRSAPARRGRWSRRTSTRSSWASSEPRGPCRPSSRSRQPGRRSAACRAAGGYRLQLAVPPADGLRSVDESIVVSETPAPRLPLSETAARLEASGQPFLFFVDVMTGRGNVLYHRYDGHYGLIAPAS